MKFKFDPHQDFQIHGVNAIVDVFEGQPKQDGRVDFIAPGQLFTGIYGNSLTLSDEEVFANIRKIQERNNIRNSGIVEEHGNLS